MSLLASSLFVFIIYFRFLIPMYVYTPLGRRTKILP